MSGTPDLQTLADHINANGGATVARATGTLVTFDAGYQVALAGAETVVGAVTVEALRDYISSVRDVMPQAPFYGFWVDGGRLFSDLSVHVEDRAEALRMGAAESQIAVWDWAAFDAVPCAA